jgi:hypothetical protein
MNYLTQALREHQELAVFLTLAIGFFIGRLKIGRSAWARPWARCSRESRSGN